MTWMIVRRERPGDEATVRAVVAAAFARAEAPGDPPAEVTLLDKLRRDSGWLPALSLVAEEAETGEIIGYVVCTRAYVDDVAVVGLGPVGVRPDRQRRGVGSALMHAVLGAAEATGEPLGGLLGEPAYYQRFGFQDAAALGVAAPEPQWGAYFQARLLAADEPVRGTFTYARPFQEL